MELSRWLALAASTAATVVSAWPRALEAQPRPSMRPRMATSANACRELASSPTALVQAPEGLALLRLKRELESATVTLERSQQLQREQMMQLSAVQRGVDSAMQVVVRYFGRDGAPREVVTIRRGDSARVMVNGGTLDTRQFFTIADSTFRAVAPTIVRTVGPQLEALVRTLQPQVAAFAERAEAQLPERSASTGYLGFTLSGAQVRIVTPDGVMTSHCEYPMVEAVDAGSPAEKAGFVAGDTVIAYNGRDLTEQAINYPTLLNPGSTVRIRVRKSGRRREIPVTVTARSDETRAMVMVRTPQPPRAIDGEFTVRMGAPTPPMPPAPPVNAMLSGTGVAVLAGAQFSTIDQEFASALDLDAGVLVLRVPPGTPAADAGMRAGEVVVRANGLRVRDVATLRRVLTDATGEVRLVVQGKGSNERTIVLRLR